MGQFIRQSVAEQVGRIVIDRPELHNAFNDEVMVELTDAFEQMARSADARVVVLASAGKSFCAGADVNWMKRMIDYTMDENIADAEVLCRMLQTVRNCPKPVIARIHGATFGGGVGLVAACDMAVAVQSAIFALTEVKLGIVPAVVSPFVIEKIGLGPARRYALTAERFDAAEARRLGLVSEVVESAEALDSWVDATAAALKANGPNALATCKEVLTEVAGWDGQRLQALTSRRTAEIRVSPEGQEGLRAFLEKRKPNW